MLSYMLPVEDKALCPSSVNKEQLQLELDVDKSPISDESIVSVSTKVTNIVHMAPSVDKPKPKLLVNGTKHGNLKRVSFGSSKGSMVETLIYESPLQEEEPEVSPIEDGCPFSTDADHTGSDPGSSGKAASRVRVTFFESEKPLYVSSPEPSDVTDDLDAPIMATPSPLVDHAPPYNRQTSTDSGWDNPFRPDGDLSREADEIVELIKGGKPITPTPGSTAPKLPEPEGWPGSGKGDLVDGVTSPLITQSSADGNLSAAPPKSGANGNAPTEVLTPGSLEVQRGLVVPPSDSSQVEHVVLKKKQKCKCCVIQ